MPSRCSHGFIYAHNCKDCLDNGVKCICKYASCQRWSRGTQQYGSSSIFTIPTSSPLSTVTGLTTPLCAAKSKGEELYGALVNEGLVIGLDWANISSQTRWDDFATKFSFSTCSSSPTSFDSLMEQLLSMDVKAKTKAYQLLHNSGCRIYHS